MNQYEVDQSPNHCEICQAGIHNHYYHLEIEVHADGVYEHEYCHILCPTCFQLLDAAIVDLWQK